MSEIRVNRVINAAGADAPNFPYGFSVAAGYGITGGGNVVGTAATFSGAVNVDATTDSTSTTTGALIVDGGAAIAKNVYIGAGLSVAGTLTYEDVTSVDSVGLITAKSGVNITGGQLQVGVAYSVGAAGITTGLGFVCGSSGFNGEAGTSNFGALNVGNAGEFKVGTAVTISSTAGVTTFSGDVKYIGGNDARTITFDKSDNSMTFTDSTNLQFGNGSDLKIYHDGTQSIINDTGNKLQIRSDLLQLMTAAGKNEYYFQGVEDGAATVYYNNSAKLDTTNEGIKITGFTSTTAGLGVTGGMWEGAFIKAGKLSDNKTIGISTSNIFYFSTQETTTSTPNIIWNDTYPLSSKMKVGDAVTVTVISNAAAGGYSANWTIDGNAVSEQWNGGSAPAAGGANGFDVYTLTIIRKATGTGDTGWIVFANVSNFT